MIKDIKWISDFLVFIFLSARKLLGRVVGAALRTNSFASLTIRLSDA